MNWFLTGSSKVNNGGAEGMAMLNADEQKTLELIVALKENERAMGQFYAACAAAYAKHGASWQFLQAQEEAHVVILEEVEKDFQARPHRWRRNKIAPETVRFITGEIRKNIALVAGKKMHEAHAVAFSMDTESSLVEKELLASVSTSDPDFEIRLARLRSEDEAHRQRLQELKREVKV